MLRGNGNTCHSLERRVVFFFACGAIGLYVLAFAKDKLGNAVLDVPTVVTGAHPVSGFEGQR